LVLKKRTSTQLPPLHNARAAVFWYLASELFRVRRRYLLAFAIINIDAVVAELFRVFAVNLFQQTDTRARDFWSLIKRRKPAQFA
jgi:hypothetical protein